MIIQGTNGIISDNSFFYCLLLKAVVLHADADAEIKVYKHLDKLNITITPDTQEFREDILKNILTMHNMLNIKPEFSKSTKIQRKLIFTIML